MDIHRKEWNIQQQALRQDLTHGDDQQKVLEIFKVQHAMVHAADMADTGLWSFQDEVLAGLSDAQLRLVPHQAEHSIAWILWHLARIEDVTMNILVADTPQVLCQDNWLALLRTTMLDTGNSITPASQAELTSALDLDALLAYRSAVGRRTQAIVRQLLLEDLRKKVEPARLQRIKQEKAVTEAAYGLLDYWGGLTLAGILLMPPTRHNFIHLNEALRIKQKI